MMTRERAREAKAPVAAEEARRRFSDLLGRAQHGHERVLIARHRKPVAALVSIDDLRLIEAIEDRIDAEDGRKALAAWRRSGRKSTSLERAIRELGIKV